jgi:hypothetical protein
VAEAKTAPLKVTATAENVTYDCSVKDVPFRPTMLFQSRVHKFTVCVALHVNAICVHRHLNVSLLPFPFPLIFQPTKGMAFS